MHRFTLAITLLALASCKKGEKKDEPAPAAPAPAAKPTTTIPTPTPTATPAPTRTPTPSTTSNAPAPSGECPAGAWKNDAKDQPRFCITLPKGYTLESGAPKNTSHHEWEYVFVGEGDNRPKLRVTVQGIAKPGVESGLSAFGPNPEYSKKTLEENVPDGKRIVSRDTDYDQNEYATETELVVLSKGETVDVSKECGSCPPWDWIVVCWSSTPKTAAPEERGLCKSLRMP